MMSFWDKTHIDACRVKRWVRTLWRCKVDVEFLVEKPVWVRSWVASGETRGYSDKGQIPTFTDPPPGLDLVSFGADPRGGGEDEQDRLLARQRVGVGGRGCHMDRTLL